MNEDPNAKWELPPNLRITSPKVQEEVIQLRKQLEPRAVSPFARLSPQEFERNRATARIHHIADDLHRVEEALKTNRGADSHKKLKEARYALAARLAENLSIVGRYDLAAEIAPDPAQQKEYAAVVQALVLDDSYQCQCAPGKQYVKQWIWSPKHGKVMPLIACAGCGTMNVSSLPMDLVKQQQASAKARELAEGLEPAEAAKVLRANNLTTEKVIPTRRT